MKRDKNSKSLEIFKKGFRKNEVVIYAIALMLVTAGYFNYSTNVENSTMETYSKEVASENAKSQENNNLTEKVNSTEASSKEIVAEKNDEWQIEETIAKNVDLKEDNGNEKKIIENIAKSADSNEVESKESKNVSQNADLNENKSNEENKHNNGQEENKQSDEDIGDAKLVDSKSVINSNDAVNDSSDYFVSTKLQRDTNYADTLSTYTKILEDGSVSETQKSIAMKEITKINDTKNAISVCENILSTKGFEHYVVLVNNESINIVVKAQGGLTKAKVAQIQNIVSREFKCKIENIHISEKS